MTDPNPTRTNIDPSLTYDDAPMAVEWLCRAFGFPKRLVVPGSNGTIVHSELSLGPGAIMVSSPKPEAERVSPRSLLAINVSICVQAPTDERCLRAASSMRWMIR